MKSVIVLLLLHMDLQTFVIDFVSFTNSIIIPFLLGIAFLLFIVNVIRFFVIGGSNDDSREKARALAMYGVLAFVFILIFWGIINILAGSFGLTQTLAPLSDYQEGSFSNPCNDGTPDCYGSF